MDVENLKTMPRPHSPNQAPPERTCCHAWAPALVHVQRCVREGCVGPWPPPPTGLAWHHQGARRRPSVVRGCNTTRKRGGVKPGGWGGQAGRLRGSSRRGGVKRGRDDHWEGGGWVGRERDGGVMSRGEADKGRGFKGGGQTLKRSRWGGGNGGVRMNRRTRFKGGKG